MHFFFLLRLAVYSIVNEEPNAEECKSKIKAYEEAHRTEIVIRQSQRADEERAIQDRIAAEQREAERRKRDLQEEEKAIALTKRKLKQESTEVLLGVSAVLCNWERRPRLNHRIQLFINSGISTCIVTMFAFPCAILSPLTLVFI